MSYAKALAKLESLPADEQELASGRYVFEIREGKPHCGCAIGKLLTEEQRGMLWGKEANGGNVSMLEDWLDGPLGFDMSFNEARTLQRFNDRAADTSDADASRLLAPRAGCQGDEVSAAEARKRLDAADRNELRIVAMARRHLGCPKLGNITILAAAQAHDEARAAFEAWLRALEEETMAVVRENDAKAARIARGM